MNRLNPRVDFAFKKLFGSEENKDILLSFINAILPENEQIADLTLKNPYNSKNFYNDKLSILDIKAVDNKGQQFNIEMQITEQLNYDRRALYYWSKLYAEQLKQGESFETLHKTIGIHILNFNVLEDEPNYHNVFHILNKESKKRYFEQLELHVIELEKFDAELKDFSKPIDRWLNFLKKAGIYDENAIPQELKADQAVHKAFQVLETLYLNDEERMLYDDHLKWLRDEVMVIKAAEKKAWLSGETEGRAEGRAEGELKKEKNMVKTMHQNGLKAEQIAQFTGLALEQINYYLT